MEYPFRTKPTQIAPEELAELNRSRRARTQKFPSYVEAYEEIRTLADRRSRRALRPLVQHPDERVPIALWHARARNQLASHVLRWLNHALAARAIADARAAGVLWTPLMDAMGQSSLWYGEHSTTLDKELEPADIRPKPGEPIEKQRVRWIQEQTDPAVLLRLINDFPSFGLHREVAREARVLSDELIKRLRSTARMDATLIANRALPEGWRTHMREQALRLQMSGRDTGWAQSLFVLDWLHTSGRPLTREERQRVMAAPGLNWSLFSLLVRAPLENDELEALLDRYAESAEHVLAIVSHPAAGIEIWRHALAITNLPRVREHIAKQESALADPEIRERLDRSDSLAIIKAMLSSASDEEYPGLFERLVAKDDHSALQHLKSKQARKHLLSRAALLPLLESGKAVVRLEAIAMLAEISPAAQTAGEKPGRKRGR